MNHRQKKSVITLLALLMLYFFTAHAVMAVSLHAADVSGGEQQHCDVSVQDKAQQSDSSTSCCDTGNCVCISAAGLAAGETVASHTLSQRYVFKTVPPAAGLSFPPFLRPPQ